MKSISRIKDNRTFKAAIIKSVPIMCSYFFVSMAYGMMMTEAGQKWYVALLIALRCIRARFSLC